MNVYMIFHGKAQKMRYQLPITCTHLALRFNYINFIV